MNLKMLLVMMAVFALTSCANLVSGLTAKMADDLAYTILNSDDLDTVREGVPAYLLLIDSFLRSSPDNENLLLAASSLNGSFSIFADEERARLLMAKSLTYALKAACISNKQLCNFRSLGFREYRAIVDKMRLTDLPVAYATGVAWAGWIQANSDDLSAIAELAKVRYLMERIIVLDETWENGGPHLYMGALETIFPAAMGGNPEKGREHFEKALALSQGKYLMAKVIYAEQYARLVFNKEIHDRLLNEVVSSDPVAEGMTLTNKFAQLRAKELLASSDDYF